MKEIINLCGRHVKIFNIDGDIAHDLPYVNEIAAPYLSEIVKSLFCTAQQPAEDGVIIAKQVIIPLDIKKMPVQKEGVYYLVTESVFDKINRSDFVTVNKNHPASHLGIPSNIYGFYGLLTK